MAQRNGFYSIRKYARLMCNYIFLFGPVIRKLYPNNAALIAALDTAMAACEILVNEIDQQAPQGV